MEIIQVAESVSREKGIEFEVILSAMRDAIRATARKKYGYDQPIDVSIDRKNGKVQIYTEFLVVDEVDLIDLNDSSCDLSGGESVKGKKRSFEKFLGARQSSMSEFQPGKISLKDAMQKYGSASIGDIIRDELPPLDLNRMSAIVAKNVIISKIKEVERIKQYEEYKDRIGEVVNGIVDKVERSRIFVKLGNAEAIIKRDGILLSDRYRNGDRIRACLVAIEPDIKGPQLILSRTSTDFVLKLFQQEVPEIYDNIIEIKSIARDPGSRSKIAVYSSDTTIDAVGSCVGIRGSRVQAVIQELRGEKVDIVQWSSDVSQFVINAMSPIEVTKIIIDENKNKIEIVVEEESQSAAIGRRGQNVKLISQLVGYDLTILTKEKEAKRRNDELARVVDTFVEYLHLEEILAQLLASEGYTNIASLANSSAGDLLRIQGLDEEIANELIERAVEARVKMINDLIKDLDLTEELAILMVDSGYINPTILSKAGVNELSNIDGVEKDVAIELLTRARDHCALLQPVPDSADSAVVVSAVREKASDDEGASEIKAEHGVEHDSQSSEYREGELSSDVRAKETLVRSENDNNSVDDVKASSGLSSEPLLQNESKSLESANVKVDVHSAKGQASSTENVSRSLLGVDFIPDDIKDFCVAAGLDSAEKIAELDNFELKELLAEQGCSCDIQVINDVIMNARSLVWKN